MHTVNNPSNRKPPLVLILLALILTTSLKVRKINLINTSNQANCLMTPSLEKCNILFLINLYLASESNCIELD